MNRERAIAGAKTILDRQGRKQLLAQIAAETGATVTVPTQLLESLIDEIEELRELVDGMTAPVR